MYIPRSRTSADSASCTEEGIVEAQQRASNCGIEVEAGWRSLQCLTPDATQLADADWRPLAPAGLTGNVQCCSDQFCPLRFTSEHHCMGSACLHILSKTIVNSSM